MGRLLIKSDSHIPKWINLGLAVFLVTALIGVWAASDREAAWAKFWLIAASVLLFYALSNLAPDGLWVVVGSLVLLGDVISLCFLLASNGQEPTLAARIFIRAGLGAPSFIPAIQAAPPNHDIVGGLLAMLQPFTLALGWFAWKEHLKGIFSLVLLSSVLCSVSLIATGSFSAWLALGVGLGIWFLWEACRLLESRLRLRKSFLFWASILVCFLVSGVLLFGLTSRLPTLANSVPTAASFTTRLQLYRNTLELVPDFLFTGGGLAAFSGLYSQYILGVPYFMFGYSHNLYLDLVMEQGLPGLVAFLTVIFGSLWLLVSPLQRLESGEHQLTLLSWAILAALIVLLVNGLGDDPLYGQSGTALLFLVPGMAVAVYKPTQKSLGVQGAPDNNKRLTTRPVFRVAPFALAGALVLVLVFYRPVLAGWYADLGSVEMARIELAGWPTGKWESNNIVSELRFAREHFIRSLSIEPSNVTAHYRLGMIAMLERRYDTALLHLEAAHQADPHHRGLQKQLGFSYLWSGQVDSGLQLLYQMPGLRGELDAYTWWWHTQGRDDLAAIAQESGALLQYGGYTSQP